MITRVSPRVVLFLLTFCSHILAPYPTEARLAHRLFEGEVEDVEAAGQEEDPLSEQAQSLVEAVQAGNSQEAVIALARDMPDVEVFDAFMTLVAKADAGAVPEAVLALVRERGGIPELTIRQFLKIPSLPEETRQQVRDDLRAARNYSKSKARFEDVMKHGRTYLEDGSRETHVRLPLLEYTPADCVQSPDFTGSPVNLVLEENGELPGFALLVQASGATVITGFSGFRELHRAITRGLHPVSDSEFLTVTDLCAHALSLFERPPADRDGEFPAVYRADGVFPVINPAFITAPLRDEEKFSPAFVAHLKAWREKIYPDFLRNDDVAFWEAWRAHPECSEDDTRRFFEKDKGWFPFNPLADHVDSAHKDGLDVFTDPCGRPMTFFLIEDCDWRSMLAIYREAGPKEFLGNITAQAEQSICTALRGMFETALDTEGPIALFPPLFFKSWIGPLQDDREPRLELDIPTRQELSRKLLEANFTILAQELVLFSGHLRERQRAQPSSVYPVSVHLAFDERMAPKKELCQAYLKAFGNFPKANIKNEKQFFSPETGYLSP